jgi:hypothetical protein
VTQLILLILLHVALGLALAAALWAAGLGLLAALTRGAPAPAHFVFAYPLGLLAVVVVAVGFLLHPVLGVVALAGAAIPVGLFIRRLEFFRRPLERALVAVGSASPFVVGLPVALGLLLHGPSEDVPSRAYGDYVFWATRTVSAARSVLPFDDLLVADRSAVYIEGASTFLGAALTHLPGVDVFLFQTTALPTLALASICGAFGLLAAGPRAERSSRHAVILAVLGVAAIAYPTWLTESPPVALAVPIGFTLYGLWAERLPVTGLLGLAAVVAVDLYLTKGFVGLILLILVGVALARDHRAVLEAWFRPARAALVLLVGGGVTAMLWRVGLLQGPTAVLPRPDLAFMPADALRGLADQLHGRDTQAAAPAFAVAGQLVLGAALLRARAFAFLAALVVGMVTSWTVELYGFDLVVGLGVLLATLLWWQRPALLDRQLWLVVPAALLLAVSTWFRDISGARAGFVFVVLFGAAMLAALLALERARRAYAYTCAAVACALLLGLAGRSFAGFVVLAALAALPLLAARMRLPARTAWAGGLAAATVASLAATAVAIDRDDFRLSDSALTLTTDHHNVWREVHEVAPPDSLVFTSMTGEVVDGEHAWNYYPGVSGRQLYIGGWFDGPLLVEPQERARRLRFNRLVLSGKASPTADPIAQPFSSYYAVVRSGESVPPSFRRLYSNSQFAIYSIES